MELDDALYSRTLYTHFSHLVTYLTPRGDREGIHESETEVSSLSSQANEAEHQRYSFDLNEENQCCSPTQQDASRPHLGSTLDRARAAERVAANDGSSDGGLHLPLLNLNPKMSKSGSTSTIAEKTKPAQDITLCDWLPLALRWPYLVILSVTAVVLGVIAIYSNHN